MISAALMLFATAHAEGPEIPQCFTMRPRFRVADETHAAGTMFPVKLGERTVLVTSHHLFGPAGGMPKEMSGAEVADKVSGVTLSDAYTMSTKCGRADRALTVADAKPMADDNHGHDIAAFLPKAASALQRMKTGDEALKPLELATAAAKKGQTVYVAAKFLDSDTRTVAATVVSASDNALYYKFPDPKLNLTATSGAAILNAEGAVVGIHLGGGKSPEGNLIGLGNPLPSVRKRLEAATASL